MKQKNISFKEVSKFVWKHYKKKPFWMLLVFVLLLIQAGIEVSMPYFIGQLIDYISSIETINEEAFHSAVKWLFILVSLGVSYHTFNKGTHLIYDYFLKFPAIRDVGVGAFYKVQRLSTEWHIDSFTGSIITKIKRGVHSFEIFSDSFYAHFFPLTFVLMGILLLLTFQWKEMGWVFIIASLSYASLSIYMNSKYIAPIARKSAKEDTRYGAKLADAISCNATVKMFGNEEFEDKKFKKVAQKWMLLFFKRYTMGNIINYLLGILINGLKFSLIFTAIYMWYKGEATIGNVVFIIGIYNLLQVHLRTIGEQMRIFQQSVNDMEEIVEYDLTDLQVANKENTEAISIKHGGIVFNNVEFQYPGLKKNIYKNLCIDIQAGQKVALVGKSGSGKSTFIKLIQRLYDIKSGSIVIDGQNISEVTQESLRKNIALVPQDPILFHRSLAENIAYAKPNASMSDIIKAAKSAHAYEFISKLDKGFKTLVGERGVKLSGGERQRVAIARAILADTPILILDEATSSLDSESEKFIQDSIHNLIQGKTAIIIAHRLSTIKEADRILVFDEGKIIEDGSFSSLIRKKGTFSKLWKMQKLD
ncbi:ABC transporter ATP-binding protein [Candidatus Peregrinibacteria bacterium]|jgi:ATP-binding cassette, subfamily B, bacterial|nr:ABC transporter ATP-binding protein [Candidatus Peregrinibacteria bacterium]